MHPLHKLGIANTVANYHEYYQTLIKNGSANRAANNAYLMHCHEIQLRNPVQPKTRGTV